MNKLSEAEASLVKRGRSAQCRRGLPWPLAGRPERRSGGEAPALLWAFGPLKAVWLRHENQARCSGGCRCGGGAEEKAAVLSQMSSVPKKAVSTSQVQTHQECVAAFPAQCPAWCAPGGRAGRCPHPAAGRETWNDVRGREQVVPTSQDPDASPEARAPCPGGQRAVLTSGVSRARTRLTRWQGLRGTGEHGGPAAAPASRPTCSGSGAGPFLPGARGGGRAALSPAPVNRGVSTGSCPRHRCSLTGAGGMPTASCAPAVSRKSGLLRARDLRPQRDWGHRPRFCSCDSFYL